MEAVGSFNEKGRGNAGRLGTVFAQETGGLFGARISAGYENRIKYVSSLAIHGSFPADIGGADLGQLYSTQDV